MSTAILQIELAGSESQLAEAREQVTRFAKETLPKLGGGSIHWIRERSGGSGCQSCETSGLTVAAEKRYRIANPLSAIFAIARGKQFEEIEFQVKPAALERWQQAVAGAVVMAQRAPYCDEIEKLDRYLDQLESEAATDGN